MIPDLLFIDNKEHREMIGSAMWAITQLELWDWLKTSDVKSFMFDNHKNIDLIGNKIMERYNGHSGSSFSYTMRMMVYIATNGFENFKQYIIDNK